MLWNRLTPRQADMVRVLLAAPGGRLERDELVRAVWGASPPTDENVRSHIYQLRKKLAGSGYVLRTELTFCLKSPFPQKLAPVLNRGGAVVSGGRAQS